MGRRDIIIGGLLAALGLGGTAAVTGYGMTANSYTSWLILLGWLAIFASIAGLARLYWTTPKAILNSLSRPDREFLPDDITTEVLRLKVEGRTSVQINALETTYSGKWMKLEGRVVNVTALGIYSEKWMLHLAEDGRKERYSSVPIVFSKQWHGQLAALNKGDWLSVVGRISGLESGPGFDHGEIIHVGEPPAAAPNPKPRAPRKKAAPKA